MLHLHDLGGKLGELRLVRCEQLRPAFARIGASPPDAVVEMLAHPVGDEELRVLGPAIGALGELYFLLAQGFAMGSAGYRLCGAIRLLANLNAKVNLIALNPGPGISFETPDAERVASFQAIVRRSMGCFIRKPRGLDIYAACGQLKRYESSLVQVGQDSTPGQLSGIDLPTRPT